MLGCFLLLCSCSYFDDEWHGTVIDSPEPSPADRAFGDKYGKPLYVISPKKDYVYQNGEVTEYEGF